MLVNKIHKQNYQQYIDRLSAIHKYSDIPDKYKYNEIDPFKPFYLCPVEMGLRQIYDEAAIVLKDFSIAEIKEIRQFLCADVLEVVYEYAKAYGEYLSEPSFGIRDIKTQCSLIDCYIENNYLAKTHKTKTGKNITIKELYAVASLKYIKKATGLIRKYFDGLLFNSIDLIKKSPKMFVHDELNTTENKIAFSVREIYQKIGDLTCAAIFVLIEGNNLKNADTQAQIKKKRLTGLLIARKENEAKKQYALKIAQQTWGLDTEQIVRIGYMAEIVYQAMQSKYGNQTPIINTIKNWIKTVCPEYANKKGRENKQTKKLLFDLYKISIR